MTVESSAVERVRFRGDLWTRELRAFARSAMRGAIGRFKRRVANVTVTLQDLNGPRGGLDARCRVCLRLHGGGGVIVQATSDNEYSAIANARSRTRSKLTRLLTRRVQFCHKTDESFQGEARSFVRNVPDSERPGDLAGNMTGGRPHVVP
jgi:putative sigma-54 modulation protein